MSEQSVDPPQRFDVCRNCETAAEPGDRRCRKCGRTLSKVTIGAGKQSSTEIEPYSAESGASSSETSAMVDELASAVDKLGATVSSALDVINNLNQQQQEPPPEQEWSPPEQPVQSKQPLKKARWEAKTPYMKFATVATKICVALFFLGIAHDLSQHGQQNSQSNSDIDTVLAIVIVGGLFVVWMPVVLKIIHRIISDGFDSLTVASTPIPSPAEISWQLGQEWGRPATLEEVAAVHQMLTSRRNEAAVTAGLTFGGIYLLSKHL
jgi:hypothetical protein